MKMYKKSSLSLRNGMLVSISGDIIIPDYRIVKQANELETLSQKAAFLDAQPKATPMPSLKGFKRLSNDDKIIEGTMFEATTPGLDFEARKTMALMDELDDVKVVEQANNLLAEFTQLIEFVNNDYVIDCGWDQIIKFDTPTIGNVLELTQRDITSVIAFVSGLHGDEDCADCDDDDCPLHPDGEDRSIHGRLYADQMSNEDYDTILKILAKYDEDVASVLEDMEDNKKDNED